MKLDDCERVRRGFGKVEKSLQLGQACMARERAPNLRCSRNTRDLCCSCTIAEGLPHVVASVSARTRSMSAQRLSGAVSSRRVKVGFSGDNEDAGDFTAESVREACEDETFVQLQDRLASSLLEVNTKPPKSDRA